MAFFICFNSIAEKSALGANHSERVQTTFAQLASREIDQSPINFYAINFISRGLLMCFHVE